MSLVHLLVVVSFACLSSSLKLPPYITPCSRNDPNLNECAVRNGKAAIPKFIHGDPKYGVPDLDPFTIQELRIRQGTKQVGLSLTLSNVKLYGLSNAEFTKSRIDLKKKHVEWDFINKKGLQLIGPYKAEGQVLVLPITGDGIANITLTDLSITYKYDFTLVKKNNGKEYMNITSGQMLFDIGKAYFKLENLFNGDKLLGDNMNRFLNENWKELINEFGPEVGGAIGQVFKQLLSSIHGLVPYDLVYPDSRP